jgi:SAM-dependent methyltransferase
LLPLEASDQELAILHGALTRLWRADGEIWARLFSARVPATLPEDPDVRLLIDMGLLGPAGFGWVGQHRFRVQSSGPRPRFYALGLNDGIGEYEQDIWPETDALLAMLPARKPERLVDIGTGTGVLAIEAAVRGWSVVATDLYERTLTLARWNARLNNIPLELRAGDQYAPVSGERFDLVICFPHYGRVFDQLRTETLLGGLDVVADGGALVTGGPLEWTGPAGVAEAIGMCSVFAELTARGADVTVRGLDDGRNRNWFQVPVLVEEPTDARVDPRAMIARYRFMTEVRPGGTGRLDFTWPAEALYNRVDVVPLGRLRKGPRPAFVSDRWASLSGDDDLAAFEATLTTLAAPECVIDGVWPAALYDGCRFGARICVAENDAGAAGAVLGTDGRVRPCAHGPAYGDKHDRVTALTGRLHAFAAEAAARRGCATCPAAAVCSRCLFPAILDENAYCDFVRRHHGALMTWHRLLPLLPGLPPPFRLRRWPRGETRKPSDERAATIQAGWLRGETWIVERDGKDPVLVWTEGKGQQRIVVPRETAEVGAAIAGGELPADGDRPTVETLLRLFEA